MPRHYSLLFCLMPLSVMAGGPALTVADFEEALQYTESGLAALVKNASVEPHWMEDRHRFWYRRQSSAGDSFVIVDARTGESEIVSDKEALAQRYGVLPEADTATQQPPEFLLSPDGERALFIRDFNLWVRDLGDDSEDALTEDGEKYAAYGRPPDQQNLNTGEASEVAQPVATHWSPNGRWIITRQVNERGVQSYPFFQAVPADGSFRPRVREVKVTLLGDEHQAVTRDIIVDLDGDSSYPISLPPGFDLDDAYPANSPIGWSGDGDKVYLFASTEDAKIGRLLEVDLANGTSRTIIEEHAPGSRVNISLSFGREPLVHILENEVIWYSERSGYGHLYLHDLESGELVRQLTTGDTVVKAVLHVDVKRRSLLVAMSRGGEADPYQRSAYRVSLDGAAPFPLTPELAHHAVGPGSVSPGGDYFVDTFSTLSSPPRSVLRHVWSEDRVTPLEDADVTALLETGWRPPHRVRVKAADGTTDLYAAVFEPYEQIESSGKFPVVDFNYLNSIASITPVAFMDAFGVFHVESLRRLGFFVVVVDGRGTPNRPRAFREAGYPVFYDLQVEDHASTIEQLSEQFDGMDIERVGIWGSSNGGAGAARAILQRPDFFKVAVSSAGSHDYMSLPPSGIKYFGVPVYPDGSAVRPTPDAIPGNYAGFDNAALAENLRGHLLLVYGDMDHYALPATTHRLVNALIKAEKTFDVLPMLNHGHFFLYEPYFKRRLAEYFVEHLHGIGLRDLPDPDAEPGAT